MGITIITLTPVRLTVTTDLIGFPTDSLSGRARGTAAIMAVGISMTAGMALGAATTDVGTLVIASMATMGVASSAAVTENAVTAVAMDEETTEAVSEAVNPAAEAVSGAENLAAEAVSGVENLTAEAVSGVENLTAEVVFTATAAPMVEDIGKVNFAPSRNSNGLRHPLQAVCFLEKHLPRRTAH
jgi:esterase/lipase